MPRPPLPFTFHTAIQKVRLADEPWNGRDPARVALAYSSESRWPAGRRPDHHAGLTELGL